MNLKIGYDIYDFTEEDEVIFKDKAVDGLWEKDTLHISVEKNLRPTKRQHVIIHELIHAITDMYGLDLSERETDLLAVGITCFIQDNPDFTKEVLNASVEI